LSTGKIEKWTSVLIGPPTLFIIPSFVLLNIPESTDVRLIGAPRATAFRIYYTKINDIIGLVYFFRNFFPNTVPLSAYQNKLDGLTATYYIVQIWKMEQ
jgi:hypothetical protein